MKKQVAFILSLCILLSSVVIQTEIIANAYTFEKEVNMAYTGVLYDTNNGYRECRLNINKINFSNIDESTFRGHIYLQAGNYASEYDYDITNGKITEHDDFSFTCVIELPGKGFNKPAFTITIHPLSGNANGTFSGELFSLYVDFTMTGSKMKYYADCFPYEIEDMKLCMKLSYLAYENDTDNQLNEAELNPIPPLLLTKLTEKFHRPVMQYNYKEAFSIKDNEAEAAKNNVAYTVTSRENADGTIDIFAIIRGTLNDEWVGNVEITGTEYNPKPEHDNFYKAAESIQQGIKNYYDTLDDFYTADKINLIITGHSRGAAVANIYASQALREIKDNHNYYEDIPTFNKVVAYTFACPNVAKHSVTNSYYYGSIYNFVFSEDIVPNVPLTNPTDGWDYWKFGRVYSFPFSYITNTLGSLNGIEGLLFTNSLINKNAKKEINNVFSYWKNVDDYYNKELYHVPFDGNNITIYDFLHNSLGKLNSKSEKTISISSKSLEQYGKNYPQLLPLVLCSLRNATTIIACHHQITYYTLIYLLNNGSNGFNLLTYEVITNSNRSAITNNETRRATRDAITYNTTEVNRLTAFANSNDNNDILEWDLTDPSSWEGVTWDNNGNVTKIDFTYKWLQGSLDVSGFTSLTKLNVYANMLTSINVDNCTALTSLDCSYNPLSSGLDLEDCTALTELYCDGCSLNTLDISDLTDLETLSCSFNNLTALDFSANTELEHLACCYNYLDTHRGGTLHTELLALRNGGAYVNYYPQRVPDNATFNTAELNALKTFALSNDNNDILDWLDENDNIDTDKLQNNVLFEYDGTEYRVVAIDIAETEVTGSLNLSALTKLEELYCERTGLTSLNVNGCTSLEVLSCYGCEIETFNLPSNSTSADSPLYSLDCEYNHIDTTMFTQAIIDNISSKDDYVLEYENQKWEDDSALAAVIEFSQGLNSEDYSEESFEVLSDLLDAYEDYENYLLTQQDIDDIVVDFLTAISDLEPYLKLKLSGDNGTVTTVYDGETQSGSTHSVLFGESVTLTATPDTNYVFDGWYERITQRVYSTDSTYTFPMTTNLDFVARFVKQNAAILSFTNDTGQIVSKIDNTPTEWNDVTTLDDLLPDVPYKLGHVNGRWNYIESEVLTALRAGTDVTITPVYDESDYVYPEAPLPVDGNPVLNLTFTYDETNDIGSFIMGAGLPQNLDIESMGIAFYFKNKNTFVPDNYILNINNKAVVSRFDNTVPDNRYIVNVHRFAEKYNWCARGFVTYRENDVLKIAYSNQMNITNTVQNNRRIAISRSVENELPYHIDVIDDED